MAISYVGKSAFASGQAGLTVGAVAGVEADDLILMFVETANESVTAPANFDYVNSLELWVGTGTAGAAGGVRLYCFYRWADGADTTNSVGDSGNHTTAIKVVYRGVDRTTPFDAAMVPGTKAAASTTATWPGITTVTDDAWIVLCSALDLDAASTATTGAPTNANLSGLTERHDQTVSTAAGGGLVVIDGQKATAGATGTTTATVTSTVQVYATIALRPLSLADIAGDLLVQESGSDTFAGSGTVEAAEITGNLAAVEVGSDTWAGAGTVAVVGALAIAESGGSDTFAAAGALVLAGALVAQEVGADTLAGAGTVAIAGSLVAQDGADGFTGSGAVPIVSTVTASESGADTFTGSGSTLGVPVEGSIAAQEVGPDLFAGVGNMAVAGSLAAQDGADSFSGAATVLVVGSGITSETGSDAFTGAALLTVEGGMAVQEGAADTMAALAGVRVAGAMAVFEGGGDLANGAVVVAVIGSAALVEVGADVFAGTGGETVLDPRAGYLAAVEDGVDAFVASASVFIEAFLALQESGPDTALGFGQSLPLRQYPLAGMTQALPLAGTTQPYADLPAISYPAAGQTQAFPLQGQAQTYPLG